MRSQALLTTCLILPLLGACQGASEQDMRTDTPIDGELLATACNNAWELASFLEDGTQVALEPEGKITFECTAEGKVGGSAGVNRYFGSFQLDDLGQLEWSDPGFGSTMMAGPEALMAQEQRYLAALPKTRHMRMDGLELVLTNVGSTLELRYTADVD